MEPFHYHVYVCNQVKPEGVPCCCTRGAEKVIEALRREVVARDLATVVQITTCGSLGLCHWGPNMVVYPEGIWYSGVTVEDVPEIVREHFKNGKPVTRLVQGDREAVRTEINTNKAAMMAALKARDAAGILPDDFMADVRSFQKSRMLLTAVELDIFTAVGEGGGAAEVAGKIDADARATEMLLNALTAAGLLLKEGAIFRNGPVARRYLAAGSSDDSRASLMHSVHLWKRWDTLTECVKKGTSVTYTQMTERDDAWVEAFIAAMHKSASFRAGQVVRAVGAGDITRLLDVGGGSGAYSIAFAQANDALHAEIFDLPKVAPIAQRHIDQAGVSDRVTTRVGDLHTDKFGVGYDGVLISAIYHMNSPEENRDMTAKAFEALSPGGRIIIQDFILDPDKTSPFTGALFALNMLVATPQGSSYSVEEYSQWLGEAGFEEIRHVPLMGPTSLMTARRPDPTS